MKKLFKKKSPFESMGPINSTQDSALTKRLKWWEEARFGLFIHWGLYAIPAGRWKGKYYERIGEWIMHSARIPVKEYELLAAQFNPVKFDAEAWVRLAIEAGMKYFVITAKHHDGFALFDSPCSDYDIVDATPFGRDPMKDLAAACRKARLPFGFYYSQTQDWHEAGGIGNTWDFKEPSAAAFKEYLDQKVKPQLRELLTRYGPIALIWFDTPREMTLEQSLDLKRFVHAIQPDCLVSGRIGNNVGDYGSLGDNQIPRAELGIPGAWETPATLNDTWAYKIDDRNWKSTRVLLELLVDLASKGINYLLNIGPTAEGVIPRASVIRLQEMGRWLRTNGEAIYGSQASPFPYEFSWGRMTRKGKRLYFHIFQWPRGRLVVHGLRNKVKSACLLSDCDCTIAVKQDSNSATGLHRLELKLPRKRPEGEIPVVRLDLDGPPDAEQLPIQQSDGRIELPASLAEIHNRKGVRAIVLGQSGSLEFWTNKQNYVSWQFRVIEPGDYVARVILSTSRVSRKLVGGHLVSLAVDNSRIESKLEVEHRVEGARTQYFPEARSEAGILRIEAAGVHTLLMRARSISKEAPAGIVLSAVELAPAGQH